MSTEIITSLIIASSSIICQLLINSSNRKKLKADNESTKSLIVYRIDKLEQKQDKYNHLQERVFNLEKIQLLQTKKSKSQITELQTLSKNKEVII